MRSGTAVYDTSRQTFDRYSLRKMETYRLLTKAKFYCHVMSSPRLLVLPDGTPKCPAANLIYDLALGRLHLIPFKDRCIEFSDETGEVENSCKINVSGSSAYMRRSERRYNGHAICDNRQVNHVHVSHDIVGYIEMGVCQFECPAKSESEIAHSSPNPPKW